MDLVLKIILGCILFIGVIFTLVLITKLLLWYLIDKKNIRNKVVKKFTKENQQILLLGTLHHMHYQLPDYCFQHLKAVLKNYKPDLLLIESRQEELDSGNLADGPLEMFYLHMYAKELGVTVKGVDWFSYSESKPGSTNKLRNKRINDNILNESKDYSKILIAIGATHMLIESKMLPKFGFKKQIINKKECKALFYTEEKTFVFPLDINKYIELRIERESEIMNDKSLPEVWQKATTRLITDLERFLTTLESN